MSKIAKSMAILGVVAGLGVAALPLSSYAAGNPVRSGDVTVRVKVDSSIAVTSEKSEIDLGTINVGTPVSQGVTRVSVSGTAGTYSLAVIDKDEINSLALVDPNDDAILDSTKGIPATSAAAPVQKGTSAWGVKGGGIADFTAVPISTGTPLALVEKGDLSTTQTEGQPDSAEAITDVTFGVSAGSGLENGTYRDVVVFIATPDVE